MDEQEPQPPSWPPSLTVERQSEQYPDPAVHRPADEYEQRSPVQQQRGLLQRLGGLIVAGGLAVLKFGALLLKGKFLISFLISAAVYTLFFGWKFGIGFLLLLLIHEIGHVIELRRQGVPSSAPMFIPFFGALVTMRSMPRNAWDEARVGLAGPVTGSLASLVVLAVAEQTNSNLLRALAYVGFLLNLINLVPVVPLDGGRAAAALHPAFWFVGLFMVALLAFHYESPFFFIILLFVALELYGRWSRRSTQESRAYHTVTWPQRLAVGTVYLGLIAALVVGMHAAHVSGVRI